MELAMVYVTCPDTEVAQSIARELLKRHLIACANWSSVTSLYRYKTEVVNEPEIVMIMKTRDELAQQVVDAVVELHPYETPCAIVYPSSASNEAYKEWARVETIGAR